MTLLQIALTIFFGPLALMVGFALVYAFVMMVYGSWIFMFAIFGNQWARKKWREF